MVASEASAVQPALHLGQTTEGFAALAAGDAMSPDPARVVAAGRDDALSQWRAPAA